MQPDPLTEALESVVGGDNDQFGGRLQAAELDAEVLKTFYESCYKLMSLSKPYDYMRPQIRWVKAYVFFIL
ncbi:hypothetical protein ARALYDRAFT_888659 [Arabidopsis lyrata subsp. lyrata]|uniref:Uncharacterized protein n=1 Tax=Arabidopsis lyrata subsp. lyrata TaxID=81972 RepID=D7KPF5_ARALL|nr:hypothetical protein ARALYDRAFT_888659 [Arabidopsis lyrata subsp. lyrata]